jgi:hypothetical protein
MTDKIIRATITVEVPYSNELLNDGTKLDKELRKVINNAKFIPCKIKAGKLDYSKRPVVRDEITL